MTEKLKHLLQAIGSVLDIYPDTNTYTKFVPKMNSAERMKHAWDLTGMQIKDVAGQLPNEQNNSGKL